MLTAQYMVNLSSCGDIVCAPSYSLRELVLEHGVGDGKVMGSRELE
jgi:hypothetical protein